MIQAKLAPDSVNSEKITDGAVGTTEIADGQVQTADIAGNAIDSTKIADGAIGPSEIASGAVDSAEIASGAVLPSKIAPSGTNGEVLTTVGGSVQWALPAVTSDRAVKTGFQAVNPFDVLDRLVGLPISTWQYKSQPGIWHLGPTAQDFAAAFALGDDDKSIATVDAQGVALAAIQALNQKVESQARQIETLTRTNQRLETRLAKIEQQLADH